MIRFATAVLFCSAAVSQAQMTYQIDPVHSSAQFSVRHLMVSNVKGEFSKVTGTVTYDPDHLEKSRVNATIDTTTLTTRDPNRDKDLKSPEFFDIDKFPTMTFQSTEFSKNNGKLQIAGNLTIHGVTKPVVLDVDGPTPEVKDPWGNYRRGASATTTVNRKDFGLMWNKVLEGGGAVVGDTVSITLDLEAFRK